MMPAINLEQEPWQDVAGSEAWYTEEPDGSMLCPIGQGLMWDARILPSGDSYEYDNIWLSIHAGYSDPLTRSVARVGDLRKNRALKSIIQAWRTKHQIANIEEYNVQRKALLFVKQAVVSRAGKPERDGGGGFGTQAASENQPWELLNIFLAVTGGWFTQRETGCSEALNELFAAAKKGEAAAAKGEFAEAAPPTYALFSAEADWYCEEQRLWTEADGQIIATHALQSAARNRLCKLDYHTAEITQVRAGLCSAATGGSV